MTETKMLNEMSANFFELRKEHEKLLKSYNRLINEYSNYIDESEQARSAQERFTSLQEITIQKLEEYRSREVGLTAFKEYMVGLASEGLEVLHWHGNGDTEPLENFIRSALEEEMEASAKRKAIIKEENS